MARLILGNGSLDFNFLVEQELCFPLNPQKVKLTFCRGGVNSNQVGQTFLPWTKGAELGRGGYPLLTPSNHPGIAPAPIVRSWGPCLKKVGFSELDLPKVLHSPLAELCLFLLFFFSIIKDSPLNSTNQKKIVGRLMASFPWTWASEREGQHQSCPPKLQIPALCSVGILGKT